MAVESVDEPEAEDVWREAQWEAAWPGRRDPKPVMLAGGDDDAVGRSRSITDDDLEELKGCVDLGFGFSCDEIPELRSTLPALQHCYSMTQRLQPTAAATPSPRHPSGRSSCSSGVLSSSGAHYQAALLPSTDDGPAPRDHGGIRPSTGRCCLVTVAARPGMDSSMDMGWLEHHSSRSTSAGIAIVTVGLNSDDPEHVM
ncbi:unnamed protein product [Miscanthus lutarioriparius]|uniref:Uncharacterized protein n=1 Tax=Miscanthus lutarioriparius TaxID=422564 RepID=A0A811PT27_9POAL|nr:unnamed protein product [Miscanthus lutarioriparius]